MASLTKNRSGWVVLYVDGDGKRRSFYPGKMPKRAAEGIKRHLEQLLAAQKARTAVPDETSSWVAACGQTMRAKLHAHGLIAAPAEAKATKAKAPKTATIGNFTQRYIDNRGDVKESSKVVWRRCRRLLLKFFGDTGFKEFEESEDPWTLLDAERMKEHFGEERIEAFRGRTHLLILAEFSQVELKGFLGEMKALANITVGDTKDFRQWMLREVKGKGRMGVMENTARKMCSVASQIFADSLDRGLVKVNPFDHKDIPTTTKENRTRDFFLSREAAERVLAACPDAERRVIFALSRFGGMRCPSEHLSLRWPDVNWKDGRMLVTSPKTEHHDGKGSREIPLFPELRAALQELYNEAEDKTGYVITRTRTTESNLRTMFLRIIERAGLKPWPKLFHNLRATRETELAAEFPIHVVCKWIGNSIQVASKNYLQVRPEDFSKAAGDAHHFAHQSAAAEGCPEVTADDEQIDPRKKKPREPAIPLVKRDKHDGRYRTRTCDPFRVKEVR